MLSAETSGITKSLPSFGHESGSPDPVDSGNGGGFERDKSSVSATDTVWTAGFQKTPAKGLSGKANDDQKNTVLLWPDFVDRPFRLSLNAKIQIWCLPTGWYAMDKAEVSVGKMLDSMIVSAGNGDLGLRIGNSYLLMEVASEGVVQKSGRVLPSVLGQLCVWEIFSSSGIADLCPQSGLVFQGNFLPLRFVDFNGSMLS